MPDSQYRFDDAYGETATLTDGTPVLIRLLRPADRELLRRGFEALSPDTRRLRFFGAKTQLTDAELAQLTQLDGINHFALGAVREGPHEVEGLGVARFVRDPANPEVAEAAVTVKDTAQGRGLGTLLLTRLAAAARERGVSRFCGEFLAVNERVWVLLEEVCPDATPSVSGETVRVEVPISDRGSRLSVDPVHRLLGHVAGRRLALRLRYLLLKHS
jgi:GNAT superfamily N-acetyltransferase